MGSEPTPPAVADTVAALRIRECRRCDLPALLDIWRAVGLTLGPSDTPRELERLLDRNPGTCLVAESDGRVVGGVMGGFDGRRGLVHHLAVEPERWRQGVGRLLMAELDDRFRAMGVVKVSLWIEPDNEGVIAFYKGMGYEMRDLLTMSKTFVR